MPMSTAGVKPSLKLRSALCPSGTCVIRPTPSCTSIVGQRLALAVIPFGDQKMQLPDIHDCSSV